MFALRARRWGYIQNLRHLRHLRRSERYWHLRGAVVKVYRDHHCNRRHRTWTALAHCMFQRAAWIAGDGPFAVIAWCGVSSVTLHPDVGTAERSLATVDATGCGRRCVRHHDLVRLDLDGQFTTTTKGHAS